MTVKYFFEGEMEKILIKVLKSNGLIIHGKTHKFNFWEKSASKISPLIDKNDTMVIVFDTDITDNSELFIKNIKLLQKYCNKVYLLNQQLNLEDELTFACLKKSCNELFFDFYKTKSAKEFKKKYMNEGHLINKLNKNNFEINKLWSREDIFEIVLSDLKPSKKGIKFCMN